MSFQDDLVARVKEIIKDTLAEANDENIFLSIKAATINLPERLKSTTLTEPVWVIDYRFIEDPSWGLGNQSYRCELSIVELRKTSEVDTQAVIQENLHLLSAAFYEGDFDEFVCESHGSFDASPSDDAVRPLIELGLPIRAGTLSFFPGLICGDFIE